MTLSGWILVAVIGLSLFGFAMFEIGKRQHKEQPSQTDKYPGDGMDETNQQDAGNRAEEKERDEGNLFGFAEKHSGAFLVIVTALLVLMTGFPTVNKIHKPLTQDEVDMFKKGDVSLFVHGKMTYDDIFGCPHWTKFCYRLLPHNFHYRTHEQHNDADDSRCP